MFSLSEQLNFKSQIRTHIKSTYERPEIPLYKVAGYSSSAARREALAKSNYVAALSKRKWSSAKDLMLDLGLKSPICATKTMSRPYMVEITNKRIARNPGKGGNFYLWSLKVKL